MPLNAEEQEIFDFAVESLPRWFTRDTRAREDLIAAAKLFGAVRAMVSYWFGQTLIGEAQGPISGLPDWLGQHAVDRGTRRQIGESDATLKQRLRNVPDAITRPALLAAAQAIVDAEGIVGDVVMVELPRDGAHYGTYESISGLGAHVVPSGTTIRLTPYELPWPMPPFRSSSVPPPRSYEIEVSFAADAPNLVAWTPITGLDGDAVIFENPTGGYFVDDPDLVWSVRKVNRRGFPMDGRARAYYGRGYRASRAAPGTIVMILPFGATAGTETSVREMLRQKKAAGIAARVERRLSPP